MHFLIADLGYGQTGEITPHLQEELLAAARAKFGDDASVEEVDAGPSASIPAYFLDLSSGLADAIALLTAPVVVPAALSLWKKKFLQGAELLKQLGLAYAIDFRTASLLAADYLVRHPPAEDEIRIVSVTRHWMNLGGPGSDYLRREDLRHHSREPLDRHFEAVQQLDARYVIMVGLDTRAFTVLVERNGDVSHLAEVGA